MKVFPISTISVCKEIAEIQEEQSSSNSDVGTSSLNVDLYDDVGLRKLLLEHSAWRATYAGDIFDRKLASTRNNRVDKIDIVTCPEIYLLCQRPILCFIAAIGISSLYLCFNSIGKILEGILPAAQPSSIELHGFRKSNSIVSSLTVRKIDVRFGCQDLQDQKLNRSYASRQVLILGVSLDFLTTDNCAAEKVFFTLVGSVDGITNQTVGSSRLRWTSQGIRFLNTGINGCDAAVDYDYHHPWPWYFSQEAAPFLFVAGSALLATSAFACFKHHRASKDMLVSSIIILSGLMIVSSIGFVSLNMLREAFYPFASLLGFTTFALVLFRLQRCIFESLAAFGLYFFTARILNDCILFEDCPYLLVRLPVAEVAFSVMGVYFMWRKRQVASRALARVGLNRAAFDQAWHNARDFPGENAALQVLSRLEKRVSASATDASRSRQYNRAEQMSLQRTKFLAGRESREHSLQDSVTDPRIACEVTAFEIPISVPGSTGLPVTSICQLYSQAMFVAPILSAAASEWARICDGRLDYSESVRETSEFLPRTVQKWMLAGIIKDQTRAIKKALSCYDGDVSRLLDVCRCRIVFDRVADMAKCLEVVGGLEQVLVMRVKNGMSEAHDAALSGGFRAVVLNLRFDSDFTRRLGLENHVCEVQLMHAAFAAVVKAGSHLQYTDFRDLRNHIQSQPTFTRQHNPDITDSQFNSSVLHSGSVPSTAFASEFDVEKGMHHVCLYDSPSSTYESPLYYVDKDQGPGMDLEPWLRDVTVAARDVCFHFTLGACGSLDRHASDFERALDKSSSYSVLFSSRPLASYSAKPIGKFRTLLLALVLSTYATFFLESTIRNGKGHFSTQLVRMRVLELLDSDSSVNDSSIAQFGLLHGSCKVSISLTPTGESESVPTLKGNDPEANGYYFTVGGVGLPETFPVAWAIEGSDNNGVSWQPVGRCAWITLTSSVDGGSTWLQIGGAASWFVGCLDASVNLPRQLVLSSRIFERGALVRAEFGHSIPVIWLSIGFSILPLGWFLALVAALFGQVRHFKPILVMTLASYSGWSVSWQAVQWFGIVGRERGAYLWITWSALPALVSAIGFHFFERQLVLVFLIAGFVVLVGFAYLNATIYGSGVKYAFNFDVSCSLTLVVGAYLSLSSVVLFWLRHKTLCNARQLLREDEQAYNKLWESVLSLQFDQCTELCKKVHVLSRLSQSVPLRQQTREVSIHNSNFLRRVQQFLLGSCWYGFVHMLTAVESSSGRQPQDQPEISSQVQKVLGPDTASKQEGSQSITYQPLCSLDQLYMQAACTRPLLLHKSRHWAAASGGLFPCSGLDGRRKNFIPYTKTDEQGLNSSMKFNWCELKSVPRAVEKVIRAYGLDVSRLVDVCRQAIVFEEIKNISQCLDLVVADPDVAIVRIKNRLDPDYDERLSGGYRDVNVNLQFVSQQARKLGIEVHVCELQLILLDFAELKSEDGHRKYVQSRNLRAE